VISRSLALMLVGGVLLFAASMLHVISIAYLIGLVSGLALALVLLIGKAPKKK
jgi:hypothetical protein